MNEPISPSSLVGTWTQGHPAQPCVLIFSADGTFEVEAATPDLAGQPIRRRAVGGEWSLKGDRLQITVRATSPTSSAESYIDYVILDCGERLRLRDLEDDTQIMELERVAPR